MSAKRACDNWDNAECEGAVGCPPRCPRFFDDRGAPLLIREFCDDDGDDLVEMYASLGVESRTMGIPPADGDALRRWLTGIVSDGWSLLATRDGRVVGHAAVTPEGDSEPDFVVFVRRGFQGRGIGTELIKQVLAYAEDRDHERLLLDVSPENERAITVYQNVGFETVERTGMSRTMELPLAAPVVEECQRPPADRYSSH